MIVLLVLTTFMYALMTLYRKTYLLNEFNIQTWMMINSGFMFGLLGLIAMVNPKDFFDKNALSVFKKNLMSITIYKCVGIITTFVWLYLLKKYDMSKLMPLNMILVTLFTTVLGVSVLGEKITIKQSIGIFMAICSIYLIQY